MFFQIWNHVIQRLEKMECRNGNSGRFSLDEDDFAFVVEQKKV